MVNQKYNLFEKISCKLNIHSDPLKNKTERCDIVSCYCGQEWYYSGWKLGNNHPKKQVWNDGTNGVENMLKFK